MNVDAASRARAFVLFLDGLEEAGLGGYARRGRAVADDLLRALQELEAERQVRRSLQERGQRLQERLVAQAASTEAMVE